MNDTRRVEFLREVVETQRRLLDLTSHPLYFELFAEPHRKPSTQRHPSQPRAAQAHRPDANVQPPTAMSPTAHEFVPRSIPAVFFDPRLLNKTQAPEAVHDSGRAVPVVGNRLSAIDESKMYDTANTASDEC
jgi:hypothetical protein